MTRRGLLVNIVHNRSQPFPCKPSLRTQTYFQLSLVFASFWRRQVLTGYCNPRKLVKTMLQHKVTYSGGVIFQGKKALFCWIIFIKRTRDIITTTGIKCEMFLGDSEFIVTRKQVGFWFAQISTVKISSVDFSHLQASKTEIVWKIRKIYKRIWCIWSSQGEVH